MSTGTMKWLGGETGLGLITPDERSPDLHLSILRLIADYKQRELCRHHTSLSGGQPATARLERSALRARVQVEAAEARRARRRRGC